jgi:hypothetical protein
MNLTQRGALMLLVLAAASAGPARAEDDSVCARYEDPLAYNACLASHGPKANNLATTGARRGEEGPLAATQAERNSAPAGVDRGSRHVMRAHGRVHMEFQVR